MELTYLQKKAYQTAKDHGWHDKIMPIEHWAMLIITEISEAVQADRKNERADLENFKKNYIDFTSNLDENKAFDLAFDSWIKNTVEDELADVCIRTLDMAGVYGMKLSDNKSFFEEIGRKQALATRFSGMLLSEFGFFISTHLIESIEDEITAHDIDTFLQYVFIFANMREINLMWFIEQKMKYNENRPYMHGNRKY